MKQAAQSPAAPETILPFWLSEMVTRPDTAADPANQLPSQSLPEWLDDAGPVRPELPVWLSDYGILPELKSEPAASSPAAPAVPSFFAARPLKVSPAHEIASSQGRPDLTSTGQTEQSGPAATPKRSRIARYLENVRPALSTITVIPFPEPAEAVEPEVSAPELNESYVDSEGAELPAWFNDLAETSGEPVEIFNPANPVLADLYHTSGPDIPAWLEDSDSAAFQPPLEMPRPASLVAGGDGFEAAAAEVEPVRADDPVSPVTMLTIVPAADEPHSLVLAHRRHPVARWALAAAAMVVALTGLAALLLVGAPVTDTAAGSNSAPVLDIPKSDLPAVEVNNQLNSVVQAAPAVAAAPPAAETVPNASIIGAAQPAVVAPAASGATQPPAAVAGPAANSLPEVKLEPVQVGVRQTLPDNFSANYQLPSEPAAQPPVEVAAQPAGGQDGAPAPNAVIPRGVPMTGHGQPAILRAVHPVVWLALFLVLIACSGYGVKMVRRK